MDERNEDAFMQMYTVGQVAEMLGVPSGTIRQWEKSLEGAFAIPRDGRGARYYTQFEIDTMRRVKVLRDKAVGFEVIREIIQQPEAGGEASAIATTLPALTQGDATRALVDLHAAVTQLSENIDRIVQERVQAEVSQRLDDMEERMIERDRKLTEALRAIQEQNAARVQEKRNGFFGWLRRD